MNFVSCNVIWKLRPKLGGFDFVYRKCHNCLNVIHVSNLVYNKHLMPQPQNIMSLTVTCAFTWHVKQTHDNVFEDVMSEDEDTWERKSGSSDIEEKDDMMPILLKHKLQLLKCVFLHPHMLN